MNLNHWKKAVVIAWVLACAQSFDFLAAPKFEGTIVADYRTGGLLNVPTFMTQPYFLAAKASCPIVDRPVCGVNGKTYQNDCFMKLESIPWAYDGWCIGNDKKASSDTPPQEMDPLTENEATGFLPYGAPRNGKCPCNDAYYPVCTDKGITFANLCRAKCNGATPVQIGPCYNFYYKPVPNTVCSCPFSQELICGEDNVTYENSCVLACGSMRFKGLGYCEAPCKCAFSYKPVCGADGRNYVNECELGCAKVAKALDGRCDNQAAHKCIHCIGDVSTVCGADGQTYDNLCYLKCKKVDFKSQGPCPPPSPANVCVCPKVYLPVCGEDNATYENECVARCLSKKVTHNGECKVEEKHNEKFEHELTRRSWSPCIKDCAAYGSQPVCGSDGKTYGNSCAAACHSVMKVNVAHHGPCKAVSLSTCPCNTEFKPVCGVDGKTYLNICTLKCVGMNQAWDGPCDVIGNYGYVMSQYYTGKTGAGVYEGPSAVALVGKGERRSKHNSKFSLKSHKREARSKHDRKGKSHKKSAKSLNGFYKRLEAVLSKSQGRRKQASRRHRNDSRSYSGNSKYYFDRKERSRRARSQKVKLVVGSRRDR